MEFLVGLTVKSNLENDFKIFIKFENKPILPAINSTFKERKPTFVLRV